MAKYSLVKIFFIKILTFVEKITNTMIYIK